MKNYRKTYIIWFLILVFLPIILIELTTYSGEMTLSEDALLEDLFTLLRIVLKIGAIIITIWYGLRVGIKNVWAWILGLSTLLPFMAWISFIILLLRKIDYTTISDRNLKQIKYSRAEKIKYSIIIILLIFLTPLSIIYQGAFGGQVLDSITKKPLQNIEIDYTYKIDHFRGNVVDTPSSFLVKRFFTRTDQSGNYKIPSFFAFKLPIIDFDPYISIVFKPEGVPNSSTASHYYEQLSTPGGFKTYPESIQVTPFKQKINIFLTPRLKNSVDQCRSIENDFLKGKCINGNSWEIAIESGDTTFCDNMTEDIWKYHLNIFWTRNKCFNQVYEKLAIQKRDISFCNKIQDEDNTDYLIKSCINKVMVLINKK